MLDRLRSFFDRTEVLPAQTVDHKVVVASLMVEAARMDGHIDEAEQVTILRLLQKHFDLNEAEGQAVFEQAKKGQGDSNQLVNLTRTIKQNCSPSERIELMEILWEVVQADGVEHAFETNLMRRLAGLIYVNDRDSGEARKRMRTKLGLD